MGKPSAMVSDTLANTTRAAHDVGLAAWLGGAMFGKFAHNPALRRISSRPERGAVANTAWNGYNVINLMGLGAAGLGWAAARATETRPDKLSGRERTLSRVKDGLLVISIATGVLNGIQGARLAKQAPEGAVPVETGTEPAPETPPAAARIQKSLGVLGTLNIVSGTALVAVNGVLAQTDHSRPPLRRAMLRSNNGNGSRVNPLTLAAGVGALAAAVNEARRL
jgi:hypothetical protein